MSNYEQKPDYFSIFLVVLFILAALSSCSGGGSKSNPAYDPDGFLGYSDGFWDWYAEHN